MTHTHLTQDERYQIHILKIAAQYCKGMVAGVEEHFVGLQRIGAQ